MNLIKGLKEKLDDMTSKDPNKLGYLERLHPGVTGYNQYAGSVSYATKEKNRAKNKVARASRKKNRK